jgi:membrane associated rhomboid family serine protease
MEVMFRQRNTHTGGMLPAIKWIILTTVGLSLFGALFEVLFPRVGIPNPLQLFGLSVWGIKHLCLWQFVTHFFIAPSAGGITFGFLFNLFFSLYMLYMVGSLVANTKGAKDFLAIYLGSGIISGIIAFIMLSQAGVNAPIAGTTSALYGLMTAWMMLNPEAQILILFAFPLRVKWLIAGILGISFLIDLSHGNLLNCLMLAGGVTFSYLFCVMRWKIHSPYKFLQGFENWILSTSRKTKKRVYVDAKIYDFKTGDAILDDESFVDACLKKISAEGRKSLSLREKWRLRRISKRTKKKSAQS